MAGREPMGAHTRDNVPCCPTRASSWNQNSMGSPFSFTSLGNDAPTIFLKFSLNSFCAASFFFGWNGLAVIFVSRRRRSHFPMVLGCTSRTQKRTEDCLTRSAQRHRTTPSLSSSGPLITTSRSASAWLGVSNLGLPGDVSVARPSTPHSLYRSTQSRNVCRSTHANSAASARDHPSITNEIACTLRACPASFMSDAIRRSSCAVWLSRVTFTGDPITLSPGPNSVRRYESNQRRAVNRAPAPGESLFMRVGINWCAHHIVAAVYGKLSRNRYEEDKMDAWRAVEGTPFPLGCTWVAADQAYNFAILSTTATAVRLHLFAAGNLAVPQFQLNL